MPDLNEAIRERMHVLRNHTYADDLEQRALRAVLDLHPAVNDRDHIARVCLTCHGDLENFEQAPMWWPCPTVRAIAHELGIEATP